MVKLNFSFHNSKLNKLAEHLNLKKNEVVGFDLPAGYTCPAANLCRAFANPRTGKIVDGKGMLYRCYAASVEVAFKSARLVHWHNFDLLRGLSAKEMTELIIASLPEKVKVVRIHASGDFFSKAYFYAWSAVAFTRPDITFFAYTKVLEYVRFARALKLENFKLIYSHGGVHDNEVTDEPVAFVVSTPADAAKLGVPVACKNHPADDYDYLIAGQSFAIALHGTQPAGKNIQIPT